MVVNVSQDKNGRTTILSTKVCCSCFYLELLQLATWPQLLTSFRLTMVSRSGWPSSTSRSASWLTSVTRYSCAAMSFWNSSNLRCSTSTCSRSEPNSSAHTNVSWGHERDVSIQIYSCRKWDQQADSTDIDMSKICTLYDENDELVLLLKCLKVANLYINIACHQLG